METSRGVEVHQLSSLEPERSAILRLESYCRGRDGGSASGRRTVRCERLELRSDADAREGGAQLPAVLRCKAVMLQLPEKAGRSFLRSK